MDDGWHGWHGGGNTVKTMEICQTELNLRKPKSVKLSCFSTLEKRL